MQNIAKLKVVSTMLVFGTLGVFVRYISLPSSVIALVRGLVGTLFLLLMMLLSRKKLSLPGIKKNLFKLCLSGGLIGVNWILLFEAYRYTSVATATLSYYLAPVFVILVSPLVLKERLTLKKLLCVLVALVGMVFVSGLLKTGISNIRELTGVLLGVLAAICYAADITINKMLRDISDNDRTVVQLAAATVVVLPYVLLTEDVGTLQTTDLGLVLLLILGVVHTGLAYYMYFGAIKVLSAQTVAIFSYLDPIASIVFSTLFLHEPMDAYGIIGAVLILGSTLVSELRLKKYTSALQ